MNNTDFNWESKFNKKFTSSGYVSMEDGDLFKAKEIKQFIADIVFEADKRGYQRGYSEGVKEYIKAQEEEQL